MILEPKKVKSDTVSTVSPSISHEAGTRCHDLSFLMLSFKPTFALSSFTFITFHLHPKGFGIVNKAEIDVFLELSCFFDDTADVGNYISSSSAFSKTNLIIWMFPVHVLLKPGLENFEHYFTRL